MTQQRLLVSVRGKKEAIEAIDGGAHIVDIEYPGSALGQAYPLNLLAVCEVSPPGILVSTNIGEKQYVWSTASQAALGVAIAGVDMIKVGLAGLNAPKATRVMKSVVRNVGHWCPRKTFIPTFFADPDLRAVLDPVHESQEICKDARAHGVLIDTFDKSAGKCLVDYLTLDEIRAFAWACRQKGQEAWIAGSITYEQLRDLWKTGVNVICVRRAACEVGKGRMGRVTAAIVRKLSDTIPPLYPTP